MALGLVEQHDIEDAMIKFASPPFRTCILRLGAIGPHLGVPTHTLHLIFLSSHHVHRDHANPTSCWHSTPLITMDDLALAYLDFLHDGAASGDKPLVEQNCARFRHRLGQQADEDRISPVFRLR